MCHRVDLARILQDGQIPTITQEVVAHIQSCTSCRSALRRLAGSLGIPRAGSTTRYSCAACRSDIAAYIEREQRGHVAAAQAFPATWWHLWSCPTCADTYHIAHTLLDAAGEGELPPLPGSG